MRASACCEVGRRVIAAGRHGVATFLLHTLGHMSDRVTVAVRAEHKQVAPR
jgi:hypothetical protein